MEIVLTPELEQMVQRQLESGKYESATEVVLAAVKLLTQQEDIYQGRLADLQREAVIGWQAAQQGDLVDGPTAMADLRTGLRTKHSSSEE
jgi:antitoxin ParD1/3/4